MFVPESLNGLDIWKSKFQILIVNWYRMYHMWFLKFHLDSSLIAFPFPMELNLCNNKVNIDLLRQRNINYDFIADTYVNFWSRKT